MRNGENSFKEFIEKLPEDRASAIQMLVEIADRALDKDFEKTITYDMVGYVVPKSIYPGGYRPSRGEALPFLSFASQKNYIAIYHMAMYMDKDLLKWFENQYSIQVDTKLDKGKSCIRFKNMEKIPYGLLEELFKKISVKDFVQLYEDALK